MKFNKDEYLKTYEMMYFARRYEEINAKYVNNGQWTGLLHLALGEEAVAVGVGSELQPDDYICFNGRSRPVMAYLIGPKTFTAESLARIDGVTEGLAGDGQMVDLKHNIWKPSGMLGQYQGIVAGVALVEKMKNSGNCVVIGIGDAALNEGHVSEVLNMIALYKLPVVWYIQNNGVGQSTLKENHCAIENMAERAKGFGLPSATYDGNDVFLVKKVMREAMEKARKGEPSVIEFKCTRWEGHFMGDPQVYRNLETVKKEKELHDPVKMCREEVLASGLVTEEELAEIERREEERIVEAIEFALDSPQKTREEVRNLNLVYAE